MAEPGGRRQIDRMRPLIPVMLALLAGPPARAQAIPATAPYKNPRTPIVERVQDLVGRMTLDEKFWQLYMSPGDLSNPTHDYSNGTFGLQVPVPRGPNAARQHAARIDSIQRYLVEKTRLGIPMMPFEEALHGLKAEGSTVFPQAIALAATWDTALVGRVAAASARETRSRGIRDVLSPVINIATDQRWGRVEETYGEDPLLSSAMGVAFVSPFERMGVITTPKHFVANVGDGGRDSYPIEVSPRLLTEIHYPPFVATLKAGARSVMTAYNSVDGDPATQNRALMTDKLKREWGFTGFVISDAAAVGGSTVLHHTEASGTTATQHAMNSGLDVIFQSTYEQHRSYLNAFRTPGIPDSVVNAAVARVLRAKFEIGLFENPFVNPDSAAYWNRHADHIALALEAARASIVLLKNSRNALPIAKTVRSVAVIGTDATEGRLGGYSATPTQVVSILDGIRAKAGTTTRVRYAPGPGRITRDYVVVPAEALSSAPSTAGGRGGRGLQGEYFDNNRLTGAARMTRTDAQVNFGWTLNGPGRGIPYDWYSVRWTGRITAPARTTVRKLGVEANDGYRLWLDGKLIVDNWEKRSHTTTLADVTLLPGSSHDLKLEYFESTGNARVKLVWDAGGDLAWRQTIDSAVAAARLSDVAIVVAGIEEGEFRDRAYLGLPGKQVELIDRVAATGKPVIVVLSGGAAITMPWLSKVRAVLDAWYPGEQGGRAVADVLWGDYNPAGRLPMTFPVFEGQLPLVYNHKPTGRGDDYLDLTGQPLFPFGYGLSYTTFDYTGLTIEPATIPPTGTATVRFKVKNTGTRGGDEVVQFYVRDLVTSIAQPLIALKDFRRIHLAPGEERELTFTIGKEQLQLLDREMRWVVEPGAFRMLIGASSKDIRLRGDLTVR
jgi:beta-glucosidase